MGLVTRLASAPQDVQNLTQHIDLDSLSTSKDLAFALTGTILLLTIITQWITKNYNLRKYHIINKVSWWDAFKAKENFVRNAQKLLLEGFRKSPKLYVMGTDIDDTIILSPDYAHEIRNDPRLSFTQSNRKEFLGHLSSFRLFNDRENFLDISTTMVRTKLTQSLGLVIEPVSDEMTHFLHHEWTEDTEWHSMELKKTVLDAIAQLSSRVFLGPELCRNKDWQRITIGYTVNILMAISAVKRYPKFLHRLVQWIVPEAGIVRAQMAETKRIIQPVIDQRKKELLADPTLKYNDAVQWLDDVSKGEEYDAIISQLVLSMAAIHTTGDLLSQVLYDICMHQELIQPLREEAIAVIGAEGWKRTSLYNLKLMDSVIKESQRLKPASMLSMRRHATENVTLEDGHRIPKGSMVGVSAHWSWDESVFENPDQFDGYRFYKMSQNPNTEKMSHLVATSPQHLGFGYGKHSCPGRFFAASEVKIALVHILLKYDIKLDESGPLPHAFNIGYIMNSDHQAKVLIRRRKEEISLD